MVALGRVGWLTVAIRILRCMPGARAWRDGEFDVLCCQTRRRKKQVLANCISYLAGNFGYL